MNFGHRKSKLALGKARSNSRIKSKQLNNIEAWRSLVARLLWEQDAAGSSPVASTIQNSNRKVAVFYFADEYRFRTEQTKINKTFLLSDMI